MYGFQCLLLSVPSCFCSGRINTLTSPGLTVKYSWHWHRLSLEQVAISLTGLRAQCRNVTFYISQIIEILFMAFNFNWKGILDIQDQLMVLKAILKLKKCRKNFMLHVNNFVSMINCSNYLRLLVWLNDSFIVSQINTSSQILLEAGFHSPSWLSIHNP